MIVTQLQPPPPTQVQRVALEAEETTPDFLSFRLVNKRARVKLSPQALDLAPIPSKAQLFAVANVKGWFAAIICNPDGSSSLICSPLADLRSQLSSRASESEDVFRPQRTVPLTGLVPNHVAFACNESRLLVALVSGPIHVFDATALCSAGESGVSPLHTFPSTTSTGARHICPNPGDIPELVAVLREADGQPDSQLVEVLNVMTMQSVAGWKSGGSSETFPTSLSWSPKGKQLAIGLQSGDIISFSPSDPNSAKSFIPRPPTANNKGLIHTAWLSNPAFYTIYADPGPLDPQADQSHMIVSFDSKRSTATDVSLPLSFFPTGIRPPGAFTVVLRNWDPARVLVVIGDSTTADIGVIGSVATSPTEDRWQRLSLDESATPTMPLDAEANETTMIGFELDLKNTQPFTHTTASGETVEVPPPPIMYAYASDGTVTGWYVVNTRGTPYPGMLADAPVSQPASQPAAIPSPAPAATASPFGQSTPATSPFAQAAQSTFGQPAQSSFGQSGQSTFGQTAFGQTSAFGSQASSGFGQPAFGASSFGQTSAFGPSSSLAFGKAAFGQAAGSAFGQSSSPFGQTAPPASSSAGGAFSAFASAEPAKFGQSGFGAATPMSATPTTPSPAQMERSDSVDMATDNTPSFGGLSLGGDSSSSKPKEGFGTTGMFGAAASQPAAAPSSQQSPSAFGGGSGSGFKLASGFGLYANQVQNQSQPQTRPQQPAAEPAKPASGFGQTGFGSTTAPAFGKTGFGQPAFGQSSFGQPAFGKTGLGIPPGATPPPPAAAAAATPPASTSAFGNGGAFGSYASSGFSSFATAAKDKAAEPVWKTASEEKPADMQPKSVFGGATFGQPQAQSQPAPVPAPPPAPAPAAPPAPTSTPASAAPRTPPPAAQPAQPSPAMSPSPSPSPPASPAPTEPPKASSFGFTTTPSAAPATGAFSGLKSVDSPFAPSKMNPGFGVFSTFNKDTSPFANPPKPKEGGAFSQPTSAFGGPSTPPKPSVPGSVFGQTSSLGSGRSVFGQTSFGAPTTPPASTTPPSTTPQTTTPPASSAFSAFGGTSSPFGKFAGASKPFGDLLREGAEVKGKEKETKPVSAFDNLPKTPEGPPKTAADAPKSAFEPSTPPEKESTTPSKVKKEESFPDLSKSTTSDASSYVEVTRDEEDEEEDEEPPSPKSDGEDVHDDISDFLSSDAYSDQDEGEETAEPVHGTAEEPGDEDDSAEDGEEGEVGEEEEEEGEEPTAEDRKAAEPANIPLPPSEPSSRSPSATPRSSHPSIRIEPGTPQKDEDKSTTPPGSPSKSPTSQPPLFQPTPGMPSPSPSPSPTFGIGLGRPSTRPLRSSPLASAPVSLQEEERASSAQPGKPHPASPKTPFGQWKSPAASPLETKSAAPFTPLPAPVFTKPAPAETDKTEKKESRPKTPPLLSSFGKPSAPVFTPPSTSKPPSLFTPPAGLSFPPSSPFSMPPPTSTSMPPPSSMQMPPPTSMSMPPSGLFGPTPPAKMPAIPKTESGSAFGNAGYGAFKQPPLPTPEEGMQAECANLVTVLENELQELRALAEQAAKQRDPMSKSSAGKSTALSIDEVYKLGKEIKSIAKDVLALETLSEGHRMSIREFESDMIKAKTRKEEILRFDKAKSDAEFAKMLKERSLSPEYIEMQNQLRKDVRALRTSIEQMEGNLQEAKKRLNEVKTGKPKLRPPSLDTVNRTYRNIEIALDQQAYDVAKLAKRLSKLDLDAISSTPTPTRDKRLPDDASKRSGDVTPHVASTTAAALNAERSAQKLKIALLAARQEPLLNTKAVTHASNVPTAFSTPGKSAGTPFGKGFSLSGLGPSPDAALALPFNLPPPGVDDSPSPSVRHHGSGTRHHGKSVKLKSSPSGAPKVAPSFDWGPLPMANTKPLSSLPVDLRSFKPATTKS